MHAVMVKRYVFMLFVCFGFISCSKESNTTNKTKTVNIDYEFTTSLPASYSVKYFDPNINQNMMVNFYGTSWSQKFTATVDNNTKIIYFIISDYDSQGTFKSNCSGQILVDGEVKTTNTATLTAVGQSFETVYTIPL